MEPEKLLNGLIFSFVFAIRLFLLPAYVELTEMTSYDLLIIKRTKEENWGGHIRKTIPSNNTNENQISIEKRNIQKAQ